MSDGIKKAFYQTKRISIERNGVELFPSFSNAEISFSSEYSSFRNIFKNEITKLNGFTCSAKIELFFVKDSDAYNELDKLSTIITSLANTESDGVFGLEQEICLKIYDSSVGSGSIDIYFNKIENDISVTDYLSSNMNLGNSVELKLKSGRIMSSIPAWFIEEETTEYTNGVLGMAGHTIAI